MDPELQKLYSCSLWSKRLPAEVIVSAHGEFMAKTNMRPSIKLGEHKEEAVRFFYKDPSSMSVENGENGEINLNFKGRKIFAYIHGGYWQWGSVDWSSFMAENFTKKDVIVAAIGYRIAPDVTMSEVVNQVERAIRTIVKYSNNSPIYICGHSAGGHLAAMMLNSMPSAYENNKIRGLILASGVFDLVPITRTDINDNLKMSVDDAKRLSPMLVTKKTLIPEKIRANVQILIAFGGDESSAFRNQAYDYLSVLKSLNFTDSRCVQVQNADHFELIENISRDDFILTKEIYKLMELV